MIDPRRVLTRHPAFRALRECFRSIGTRKHIAVSLVVLVLTLVLAAYVYSVREGAQKHKFMKMREGDTLGISF